ncbi:hypothetical protein Tco_1146675 [Tanacetum coccineum]
MGNEPILALPEGADDSYVTVYYELAIARICKPCWKKGELKRDLESNLYDFPWNGLLQHFQSKGLKHEERKRVKPRNEFEKIDVRRPILVKVRWDSKRGPELTWERKDQMRSKCPQLFVDSANASSS